MTQKEILRIIDQIEQLHNHSNWAGISLNDILNLSTNTANTQLPTHPNTIHQIVQHIITTELTVIKRLQGIKHNPTAEEDWVLQERLIHVNWNDTKNQIAIRKKELIQEIQKLNDNQLDHPIVDGYSSIYKTLHGHIQHTYYHLGQIFILKKIIENQ